MLTLKYLDNFQRETISELEIPSSLSREEISAYLLDSYQNAGCKNAADPQRLYVVSADHELLPLSLVDHIGADATIVYSDIIPPDSAREYVTCEGIEYFFHTGEKGHLNFPHIHAKESGGSRDISIYLKDYRVIGKLRNPTSETKAVKYVKENREAIGDKWNEIIEVQGGPRWEP